MKLKQYYHQTHFHRLPYDLTYIGRYLRSELGQFKVPGIVGRIQDSIVNPEPDSLSALP